MSQLIHITGEKNFLPFTGNGDITLKDDFGRLIGTCKEKNITPIRGSIDTQGRVIEILCGNFHRCGFCPNIVPTKFDTTDYDILNPKIKRRA